MNKISIYIIIFLLMLSGFFMYNTRKIFKEKELINKELSDVNDSYDDNITYAIKLEDSINRLYRTIIKNDKFSLKSNNKALDYLKKSFPDLEVDWEKYIIETLYKTNKDKADNPMIPFAGMNGFMRIDNAKVLNNRWIIAHFTDGTYSGEMIIRFDVNKNNTIDFKVLDQCIFSN